MNVFRNSLVLILSFLCGYAAEVTPIIGDAPAETAVESSVTTPAPAAAAIKTALIVIDGPIDDGKAAYFERSVERAIQEGATRIVSQLTTDGGYLHSALNMVDIALDAHREHGTHFIALVDGKAWSAGAMISYAHQEVYLMPGSHIGDVGVITMTQEGKIEYLPEKIESPVRAHLRSIAEVNGWNMAKLLKMTARNQELYRFDHINGETVFVIQDDLHTFLADHPDVTKENAILVLGEDRLVSYTAQEAVREHMATGMVDNLDALWQQLEVKKSDLIDLQPNDTELLSWSLAGFAPLLASLAMLFVFLELKTPGIGIWAILAACAGLGFFVCQYYMDLANALELVLVVIGILLIVIDLLVLPTGGILALGGGMLALTGLILAFMPDNLQFSPGNIGFADAARSAAFDSTLSLIMIAITATWLVRVLPNSKAVKRIAACGEITATSAGQAELHIAGAIGSTAIAHSDLRPAGSIVLKDEVVSATTEHGEYVTAGANVQVVGMRYGEVIVRPLPAPERAQQPATPSDTKAQS